MIFALNARANFSKIASFAGAARCLYSKAPTAVISVRRLSSSISPEKLLDFSANINPLGMPETVKRAIVDNLHLAERYPDVDYRHLHQALARHHQVPVEWILAGNGETESIFTR